MPKIQNDAQEKNAVRANTVDANADEPLPDGGELLDFVDYTASRIAVSLALTKQMIGTQEFAAATTAYRFSSAHLTLGYSAFFCWPATRVGS